MNLLSPDRSLENTVIVTAQLLKLLQVRVTRESLQNSLKGHSEYPGIVSIMDTLSKYRVSNSMARIDLESLDELDQPFIARVSTDGGSFVVVSKINLNSVTYISPDEKNRFVSLPRHEFSKLWTGIGLIAEPTDDSGEYDYANKRRAGLVEALKTPVILVSLLAFTTLSAIFSFQQTDLNAIGYSLLLFTKFSGCLVTGILLTHEIDRGSSMLKYVCKTGKNINCNAILDSPAARLLGWISWSELGFFYFAGGFLAIILGSYSSWVLSLLAWLNVLALPYTLFSVYYQWRVAKQWCLLCLIVQGLLVTEFAIATGANLHIPEIFSEPKPAAALINMGFAFALPVLSWLFIKNAFKDARRAKTIKTDYLRLKHDPSIFKSYLLSQRKVPIATAPADLHWGNKESENVITLVCSPFCRPCALAHPVVAEIVKANHDMKVQLIMSVSDTRNERNMTAMRRLLVLANSQVHRNNENFLDAWWKHIQKNDYAGFYRKYALQEDPAYVDEKIFAVSNWCKEMEITHTPSIFINGYEIPGTYTIEDLLTMLSSYNWDWAILRSPKPDYIV